MENTKLTRDDILRLARTDPIINTVLTMHLRNSIFPSQLDWEAMLIECVVLQSQMNVELKEAMSNQPPKMIFRIE